MESYICSSVPRRPSDLSRDTAKTYVMSYGNGKSPDQPAHPRSLVRAFTLCILTTPIVQSLKRQQNQFQVARTFRQTESSLLAYKIIRVLLRPALSVKT